MKAIALLLFFVSADYSISEDSFTEKGAIEFLIREGNEVSKNKNGTTVILAPANAKQRVSKRHIEAVNALKNVTHFRVIAFYGIEPQVFETLKIQRNVKLFVVHYGMPAESIAFLNRFPNVETIKFWGDQFISLEHMPPLEHLKVLHHKSTTMPLDLKSVKRIIECKNLEEVEICHPIPSEFIPILKKLPKWKTLKVNDARIERLID